jgi:hypothetical protein
MAFQITQLNFDFHGGAGLVSLNEAPTPPDTTYRQVMVNFPLKPAPTGGTPDAATAAELKAEAKRLLLEAAAAL